MVFQEKDHWVVAVSTPAQSASDYDVWEIFTPMHQCMPIAGAPMRPLGKLQD
jgi:hypothetical protein